MPLAGRVPPVKAIVRGAVTVNVPVVQAIEESEFAASPAGRTSERETSESAVVFGLVSVNVKILVLPVGTVAGLKLLERLGTVGRAQPVIVTPSRYNVPVVVGGLPPYWAPAAKILKYKLVFPVPVVAAEIPLTPVCHAFVLFHAPAPSGFHVIPSVL